MANIMSVIRNDFVTRSAIVNMLGDRLPDMDIAALEDFADIATGGEEAVTVGEAFENLFHAQDLEPCPELKTTFEM